MISGARAATGREDQGPNRRIAVWKYGGSRERERRGLQMTSLGFWRDGVIIIETVHAAALHRCTLRLAW